jgi:hypothetical protein
MACYQNIRGLLNKTDELLISVSDQNSPHIVSLMEHHMKSPEILQVSLSSCTLGTSFSKQTPAEGGESFFFLILKF